MLLDPTKVIWQPRHILDTTSETGKVKAVLMLDYHVDKTLLDTRNITLRPVSITNGKQTHKR